MAIALRQTASALRNRWWIVGASVFGLVVSSGPVNIFSFGVFLRPVTEDFGIGRGTLASAMLITNWISAFTGPVLGYLLDRWGVRRVMVPGVFLFALATAAQSLMTPSLVVIYLLFAMKGLGGAGQSPTAYATVIARWFDRERGFAMGIGMAGVGLGTAIIPLLAAYLIDTVGWRDAYLGLSIAIVAIAGLPVIAFIRDPREGEGAYRPEVGDAPLPGIGLMEAVTGSWRFWGMIVAFLFGVIALNGVLVHIVAIQMDRGISLQQATRVLAASGIAALVGRVVSGWCVDRIFAPRVAACFFMLPMVGIALVAGGPPGWGPLGGALLCGLALGAEIDLMAFFASRYFGLKSYGKILGTIFGCFAGATGVGPFLSGYSFDRFHSYAPAFALYEALLVGTCVILLLLGPYPYPARDHRAVALAARLTPRATGE
jgi:MFS family permease